jgi:2-hydroxychromene-2-carboxylate isomerase
MDDTAEIKFYFAYTSPFTYLAYDPICALEDTHRVRVRFIPYGVNIRRVYGDVPDRSNRDQLKVRYLYRDVRRFARERGIVIYPPKKIYSARYAFYAGMCADDQNLFRPYARMVFERFWSRNLEVEDADALAAIMIEAGADTAQFRRCIANEEEEAKPRLKRGFAEAESDQVFGVPTFVIGGELFWGYDRIDWLIRKLDAMNLRRQQVRPGLNPG